MKKMVEAKPEVKGPAAVEVAVRQRNSKIRVTTYKKSLEFYRKLAKRRLLDYNEVELSAVGMAIGNAILVAVFLKDKGYATEKSIQTSSIGPSNDNNSRGIRKPKIVILLEKTENLN